MTSTFFILKEERVARGTVQMRHFVHSGSSSYVTLLFEEGKGIPVFKIGKEDYWDSIVYYNAILSALKLGRNITLKGSDYR